VGWLRELEGDHVPETEEYGIASFVYRTHLPFDPKPLFRLLHDRPFWAPVLRSKGFFWIATRPDVVWEWGQAGRTSRFDATGRWYAPWPAEERPAEVPERRWDPRWGDRAQELVFIGVDMDEAAIRARLDACLVEPALRESSPASWSLLEDPFGDPGLAPE
jgi:G3E family GTPase